MAMRKRSRRMGHPASPARPERWAGLALVLLTLSCTAPEDAARPSATPTVSPATPSPSVTAAPSLTPLPKASPEPAEPLGKIVFTCQPGQRSDRNQICMMEANGGSQVQLTNVELADHLYPSLAPDGESVVFTSNRAGGYDLYEQPAEPGGRPVRLTDTGDAYAPEISPNGDSIVFTRSTGAWRQLWLMDRPGLELEPITDPAWGGAWDPTWSPDGKQILFASDHTGDVQLFSLELQTDSITQLTALEGLRGRNDWSPAGDSISTYAGGPWARELVQVKLQTGQVEYLTQGGNNLAPSYSPDGLWLAFTSYRDHFGDENGCEIYVMDLSTRSARRLTENDYCDWQPRWGR